MKDTIKNSIIGLFAIFGLVALISSSNSAPTVIHEGSNTPESHVWELHLHNTLGAYISINKVTGEVRNHEVKMNGLKNETMVYTISKLSQ